MTDREEKRRNEMENHEITLTLTQMQLVELQAAIGCREYNLTERKLAGELDADTTAFFTQMMRDIRKQINQQVYK